jgi:glucoamylase
LNITLQSGVVIASPNEVDPDYVYTWVRDSSLVFKEIIDGYTTGLNTSSSTETSIHEFVTAESTLQQTSNPSGSLSTGGTGLGEPKFNVNLTAFTGAWGRPQRDGPALRSTALITYANYLLQQGGSSNEDYVTGTLWPMIVLDADYVQTYWNQSTFDLWEEIDSSSFFTSAVQHRSLRQAAALAQTLGQTSYTSNWTTQADNILCFLQVGFKCFVSYY